MKSNHTFIAIIAIAVLGFRVSTAVAEDAEFDAATEYAALESAASEDGQAWYLLARQARLAGVYDVASNALAKAEALEFVPARLGLERARIAVATGNPGAGEEAAELFEFLVSARGRTHFFDRGFTDPGR